MKKMAKGRFVALLILFLGTAPSPTGAGTTAPTYPSPYDQVYRFLSSDDGARRAAARKLIERKDSSPVPGLVDVLFFLPFARRAEALQALTALTGEHPGERYHDWVELVGRRLDLHPADGYLPFKAALLAKIDPRYREILFEGAPARIRPEEIVWGGVTVEGIPALDRPAHVPAAEAQYLDDAERVFGVSVGGEQRAYPLRILDWHEMVNDQVGGEPITLSYCTLCGSGVLYSTRTSTRTPEGEPYTFGTSGLLYRSNKLMIDRQTLTLWNNLTGEPALGRLARTPLRLPVLPLTVTTWGEWRARHPATTVLALDHELERRYGYRYEPGAADRHRVGVRFPVWLKSKALGEREEIYAVRLAERAKAYPLALLLEERVVNDRLGERNLVVVADPASGAVRAYERGTTVFSPGEPFAGAAGELRDAAGRRWRIGEDALAPLGPPDAGDPAAPLPRLPGHQAFWFGWYSFFPDSEVYAGRAATPIPAGTSGAAAALSTHPPG